MAIKWKENQLIKQVPNLKNHFIGFLTRILSQVLLLVMTAFRHSHYFFSQACNESCVCVRLNTYTLTHANFWDGIRWCNIRALVKNVLR